jgi:IPT/TIG domain
MPFPFIRFVRPNWSPLAGGLVEIIGYDFDEFCAVTFGPTPARSHRISATQITTVAPPQSHPQLVSVFVYNSISAFDSYPNFAYVPPVPPGSVRIFAPLAGQVFQPGAPVQVRWETFFPAARHSVRLLIPGRGATTLSSNLPGTARQFVFGAPDPWLLPSIQATVEVAAFDSVGQSVRAGQPFTVSHPIKGKEKEGKEKEKDILVDKTKELREGPR